MRHSYLIIFLAGLLTSLSVNAQSLVPIPVECTVDASQTYAVGDCCGISAPSSASSSVDIFAEYMDRVFGIQVAKKGRPDVVFKFDPDSQKESYKLSIGKKGVVISGGEAGVFYGMRTLQQLMDQYGPQALPYIEIEDSPRFEWRGLMLDCGRYFYSVDFIKQYIDRMSYYKMNTFHWHLSEDSGWRIEIKSHPELVANAAWRRATAQDHAGRLDNVPHGGYYTQKQVREIVEYAAERHVTIVPEIDLPGHTMCILASHPELNCTGEEVGIPLHWGVKSDVLCIGNEGTLEIIKDILTELIDLFPSQYIDVGGDEAPQYHWDTCEKCRALMEKENIETTRGLQSWLTSQMDSFVRSKGRRIIGWDEILEGGNLSSEAAVMSWRGTKGGIEAARSGHKVVMAPSTYMYIDYYQSADMANEPINIGGYLPLSTVYSYEPFDPVLTEEECNYIIGVQANLWCEFVHNTDLVWYMTYPRALACAEIGWSPRASKDYHNFCNRLATVLKALDRDQIPFRIPEPFGLDQVEIADGKAAIELELPVAGSQIFYSTDGSDPGFGGQPYTGKITLPLNLNGIDFKCAVRLPSGRYSAPYSASQKKE